MREDHGIRQRYFREAEGASGERLPVPHCGVTIGNWRILRGLFEVEEARCRVCQRTGFPTWVHSWLLRKRAIKKRPRLFSPGRLGSPPPELPNHEMDTIELPVWCKRHFGNQLVRVIEGLLNRPAAIALDAGLESLP